MCVRARWSTITSKSNLFNKWEKLSIFIGNPHNSILLWNNFALLLAVFYLCMLLALVSHSVFDNVLPIANLLVSEYGWNLPLLLGRYKTGGLVICTLFLWMLIAALFSIWIVYLTLLNHKFSAIPDKTYLENLPSLQSFYIPWSLWVDVISVWLLIYFLMV